MQPSFSRRALLCAGVALSLAMSVPSLQAKGAAHEGRGEGPLVIAHRGASGYLPEHTLAAYWLAIEQGADFVEPDLVITKDRVLVARHENAIAIVNPDGSMREATTDVAERAEFASRKTTKLIDGQSVTGWFTEDFTLAELKTLRARERLPQLRTANTRFDGMFDVPTLEEVIDLVKAGNERRRAQAHASGRRDWRPVGIYPETKHPTYFQNIGLPLEEPLVRTLRRAGLEGGQAMPVYVQSFEVANLRKLQRMTRLPLVQLLNSAGRPYDFVVSGDPRTYADLVTAEGLREIAGYAHGVGPEKSQVIPVGPDGTLGEPTALVDDAHAAGLLVHPYTFRNENAFLPPALREGVAPQDYGLALEEQLAFWEAGIDGMFTDNPDTGVVSRELLGG